MDVEVENKSSCVVKNISSQREHVGHFQQTWDNMLSKSKFSMKENYAVMIDDNHRVPLRYLLKGNNARSRALLTLWFVCHGKLAIKDRLKWFGMIHESRCSLCLTEDNSISHLFFDCRVSKAIWKDIFSWLEVNHDPEAWFGEINWVMGYTKRKWWKTILMKLAVA
ncbi:uncharacterized protein LOC131620040 [Vicia villosa]|uniref:uncharacterized protein LOC131620040 n=1 Tax=Vicia villosa TaxID=3911 RepID=UPI00273B73B6|nr:uncharacterized protein LOC131620040 [Vicia villosa]